MNTMYRLVQLAMILSVFTLITGCNNDKPDLPKQKRTDLELYFTTIQAYDYLKKEAPNSLFIDVRTEAEAAEGMPAPADANIPIVITRDNQPELNKDFVTDIETRLNEKGLNKDSTILLLCRQGNRSAVATNTLAKAGYKKVYNVVDGAIGWRKNNLPWTQ
jgi:rhodanese-related sulfurtransferase